MDTPGNDRVLAAVVEVQVTVHDEPDDGRIETGVTKRLTEIVHLWTVGVDISQARPDPRIKQYETVFVVDRVAHRDAALSFEGMLGRVNKRG